MTRLAYGANVTRPRWVLRSVLTPRALSALSTPTVLCFPNMVTSRPISRHHYRHPNYPPRSEEHTSELQSRFDLVCRLLLEKKKLQITAARPLAVLICA